MIFFRAVQVSTFNTKIRCYHWVVTASGAYASNLSFSYVSDTPLVSPTEGFVWCATSINTNFICHHIATDKQRLKPLISSCLKKSEKKLLLKKQIITLKILCYSWRWRMPTAYKPRLLLRQQVLAFTAKAEHKNAFQHAHFSRTGHFKARFIPNAHRN